MKTILAPTDFSASSLNAVYYAADLALAIQAKLVLLHSIPFPIAVSELSVPDDFIDDMIDVGQRDMDELYEKIMERTNNKISISTEVRIGTVEKEIEITSLNEKPLAIVLGIRNGKSLERALMGSSVFHVMNHIGFPTLIIPENARYTGINKIGMACDFKKVDDKLPIETIKEWLSLFNASLDIINIAEINSHFKSDQTAESIALQIQLSTRKPRFHFLTGENIAEELNKFLSAHPVDLLMVFPRKHGIFKFFHKKKSKMIVTRNLTPILSIHDVTD